MTRENPSLRISVVLVTFGRAAWLERCLLSLVEAWEAHRTPGLKLQFLVGVNGPDRRSLVVLEALRKVLEPLGSLQVGATERPLTPAAARNLLVRSAEGEWVLFVDDDAFVDRGFFSEFLRLRELFPEAGVFGGPNLTPSRSTLFQRATGVALASRLATFFSVARYLPVGPERPAGEEDLILCNLLVRGDLLGPRPFAEDFLCGEEQGLLQALEDAGQVLVHAPELRVWHERRPGWRSLATQVFRYGLSRARNFRRRPGSARLAHLIPSACLLYTLGFLGLLRAGMPFGAGRLLALPFVIYVPVCAGAAVLSGLRLRESPGVVALAAAVFPVIHLSYGAGMLVGFLARSDGERTRRAPC
jgi:succinoglycan biosynthesis protein ExoA